MADEAGLRHALVDGLVKGGSLTDARVEAAFRAVPRHLFLPDLPLGEVYRDQWIVTKRLEGEAVSSSSQPQIMATMLEQLALEPGQRVLEIGAGTGYNAALMAHLVGEAGVVVTVDIDDDLAAAARAHLAAAGYGRVRVVCGDGGFGVPDAAPYDRIILTVGAWDVAPAWREQLRAGGRLVLPLMVGGTQKSVAFERADGHLVSVSVKDCLFMPIRGAFAGPVTRVPLEAPGLTLWAADRARVDAAVAAATLKGPGHDVTTRLSVTSREVYGGLIPWLALHEPGFCWLEIEGPPSDTSVVPRLFAVAGKYRSTAGLFEGPAACFLMRPPDAPVPVEGATGPPFELFVRAFGESGSLAARVLARVQSWEAAGRPGTLGLRIRTYPIDVPYRPAAHEIVVTKRWSRLVLDWPRKA